MEVKSLKTDSLSRYKTFHHFENYGEICSVEDYSFYIQWAKQHNKRVFILGNGSNTLFTKKKIRSLILKNNMPKEIECVSDGLYKVSSNVMMHEILNFCFKNSLDSFYFLASVPASIGGALAMNAGEGKYIEGSKCTYDFVESVTFIDADGSVHTLSRNEMNVDFRKTMFTGHQEKFIVSAIFKFPLVDFNGVNPIKDRIHWAKQHQDNVAPNCGSVFNEGNGRILNRLKGLKVGSTYFSRKTSNWINNHSSRTLPILSLIAATKLLHFMIGKKCRLEIIRVK